MAGAATFMAVTALAFSSGGYYPTTWGWFAIAASATLAVGAFTRGVSLGRSEIAMLGAFAALVGWMAASSIWGAPARGVLEAERAALYWTWLAAALVVLRRTSVAWVMAGAVAGVSVACAYGLSTRLLPERFGVFDSLAGARLSEPLGYWNGLGVFAAMGVLLALGLAARSPSLVARILGAATIPVCCTTLYFTFSRGSWIALAVGLITIVAIDARRLQFLATTLAVAPAVALALAVAYRLDGLNTTGAPLAEASEQGHAMAAILGGAAALAAVAVGLLVLIERHWKPGPRLRRVAAIVLVTLPVVAILATFVRVDGPVGLVSQAYDQFAAPPPAVGERVSGRLFSLSGSGRVPQFRVAWRSFESEPVHGTGAGTYEEAWNELRPSPGKVRDAHSLYLETLGELGLIGAALLLVVVGVPLLAFRRVGRSSTTAVDAGGAFVVYLVHAGVDWDWEMPAITVVAVICAALVLVSSRPVGPPPASRGLRMALCGAAILVASFSTVWLVGSRALTEADSSLEVGNLTRATERARVALRWAPWSAQAHRVLGDAQLAGGDLQGSIASYGQAVEADPGDWELWFALAQVATDRAEAAHALREASRLNPRSAEIAAYLHEVQGS